MRLDIRAIMEHEDDTPSWLVQDMLAQGSLVILAGAPGVGKSVLSYTLALAVASGESFLGAPTHAGKVLYFDEENSLPDVQQYLRWAWRGLGKPLLDNLESHLYIEHFSLASVGTHRYDYMRDAAAQYRPYLIVLDTASPACDIRDENDNAEASRAIHQLRRVLGAAGPQATMLILKHARIDNMPGLPRTIRGAKTWLGELDSVLFHVADRGRPRKDGLRPSRIEPDKVRAFGLRNTLSIIPSWTADRGLKLERKELSEENAL